MTAEKMARESDLWNTAQDLQNDWGMDSAVFNAIIETLRDVDEKAYLAGQQSQWREYPKEKPEPNEFYFVIHVSKRNKLDRVVCKSFLHKGTLASHGNPIWEVLWHAKSPDHVREVTHWMPITLPATKEGAE